MVGHSLLDEGGDECPTVVSEDARELPQVDSDAFGSPCARRPSRIDDVEALVTERESPAAVQRPPRRVVARVRRVDVYEREGRMVAPQVTRAPVDIGAVDVDAPVGGDLTSRRRSP